MSNLASKVNSRFVSQSEIDARSSNSTTAGSDADYDPRSLYERLQAHKEAKDSKYDEMFKLSNQFRGIDEGESEFLAQVAVERRKEREERERSEREELELFRRAKAGVSVQLPSDQIAVKPVEKDAKQEEANKDQATTVQSGAAKKKRKAHSAALLGVVKKKPANAAAKSTSETAAKSSSTSSSQTPSSTDPRKTSTKPTSTTSSEPAPPAKPKTHHIGAKGT